MYFCHTLFSFAGTVWYGMAVSKRNGDPVSPNFCNYTLFAYFSSQVILSDIFLFILFIFMCCCCCRSGSSGSDPEARNIVSRDSYLTSGRPGRASIQTIQTDRLRAIQRGPNLLWVYETVQVNVLRVEN